jgi:hypothetical protein
MISATPNPRDFYGTGPGDRLVDESKYPPAIRLFLTGEKMVLASTIGDASILVEAGCMSGRYLPWAVEHDLDYLGIDIVTRYVEAGREAVRRSGLSPDRYRFLSLPAEALVDLSFSDASRALVFFPFNSFGNASRPEAVAVCLQHMGAPFLISTYATSEAATLSRLRYYEATGMQEVRCSRSQIGVTFESTDGLYSTAYSQRQMRRFFPATRLRATSFGEIGVAWSPTTPTKD